MALVLVMTVVLALTLIATPFVLSMILQERTGTVARYASQADYGADGVRNYAAWRLMTGVEHFERRNGGPLASYYYDVASEFEVRLEEAALADGADIVDPKGSIWGVRTADEQGKLNVRTAPLRAVNRVRMGVDDRVADRKDYLTMYSGRDMRWISPQRIRAVNGTFSAQLRNVPTQGVAIDRPFFYGPGSRVRVSKPGQETMIVEVTTNGQLAGSGRFIETRPQIPPAYLDGVVEVEQRHPVNVNTAPPEVLIAVFEGLSLVNVPNSSVDVQAAAAVAELVSRGQTRRLEDFLLRLAGAGNLAAEQRMAIAVNAIAPSAIMLGGSGTVPLCFTSHDVVSVEAFASMNNPSAVTMASRGFREVIDVSPPDALTLFCESQYDFDRMLAVGAALQQSSLLGFPLGHRFVSYPNLMPFPVRQPLSYPTPPTKPPMPSDVSLKPQQAPGNLAYVMPAASVDFRGRAQWEQALQGWTNNYPREHFLDAQDGKPLNGQPWVLDWTKALTTDEIAGQQNQNQNQNQGQNAANFRPTVTTGGMEMWVRMDGVDNPMMLFDIREDEWRNRLSLRIESGELILTACDGSIDMASGAPIDNGAAQVRMPLTPETGDWYHFSAAWKDTGLGGLALFVDGFAHPQQVFEYVSPEGQPLMTELNSMLSDTGTSIALKDDSWIPQGLVALQIGAEVIHYDKANATMIRGARGTTAMQHPANAKVRPFGYSSKIRNGQVNATWGSGFQVTCGYQGLRTGGGTLRYSFGFNPQATTDGTQQDPMTMVWFVDATETDIPVNTLNIDDFPDEGYIMIDGEVIHYTGRQTGPLNGRGTAHFTGCTRGQAGTTAAQHNMGRQVRLWGFPVSDTTQYESPTVIAIGDEFFLVQRSPDASRSNTYWTSFLDSTSGNPVNLRRGYGVFSSIQQAHTGGDRVMPTFLARATTGNLFSMGRGDYVTITDAANRPEPGQVRNAYPPYNPNPTNGNPWSGNITIQPGGATQIVNLDNFLSRDFVADDYYTRALKFPSGELLGLEWLNQSTPQFAIGPMNATIDEVKFFADPGFGGVVAQEAADNATSMQITGQLRSQYGAIIKVGSEVIGVVEGNQALSMVNRGFLASTREVHDVGDPVFPIPWLPCSALLNDMGSADPTVALRQKFRGVGRFMREGLVLIDDELLHFEGYIGDELRMPAAFDGTQGLYRGRFGTSPSSHSAATALAYLMPFRYWDTYRERQWDNTMVWFQWSQTRPMARWGRFVADVEIPKGDPNVVLHAFARVDGKGDFWNAPGVSDKSIIFHFPGGANGAINQTGYRGVEAGQLDVRFMVEYRTGAFDPQGPWNSNSWKRAPKIRQIQVDYERPTRTLYHEDK